jgi:hypothetical protein
MVLYAFEDDTAAKIATRRIGPALVFERCGRRPAAGR